MVETAIVEKIRKLLKLAADPSNAHEAALAAERAQALLLRHHLDMADVALDDFAEIVEVDRPVILVPWRKVLAAVLCSHTFCRLLEWSGGVKFIGRKADVEAALYLYVYLSRTIQRLAREGWTARVRALTDPVFGRYPSLDEEGAEQSWKDSFCIGAVEIIGVRLHQQREAAARTAVQAAGLIKVARHALLVTRYIDTQYAGRVTQGEDPEVSVNMDGFTKGVRTGKALPISRGLKGGGDPPRGIDG